MDLSEPESTPDWPVRAPSARQRPRLASRSIPAGTAREVQSLQLGERLPSRLRLASWPW